MNIGVPKEVKTDEFRVSMTPSGVVELVKESHSVYVEKNAGAGSGFSDEEYEKAGAILLNTAKEVFDISEMIVKVKEPIASEYALFKEKQTLFTYLHLAADKAQTDFLLKKGLNSKNGCLKHLTKYGIVGVNKGLFTNGCKKALKYV